LLRGLGHWWLHGLWHWTAGTESVQACPSGRCGEEEPIEGTECNGRLCDIADVSEADTAAEEDGECDEPGEPEGHGRGVSCEESISVVGNCWELVHGCEAKVCCCDQAVYRAEKEEVDLGWRHVTPVVGPPVGDICSEAEHNDREDALGAAKRKHEVYHLDCLVVRVKKLGLRK